MQVCGPLDPQCGCYRTGAVGFSINGVEGWKFVSHSWPKEAVRTGNGLESTFRNIYLFYILNIYVKNVCI